MTIEEQAAARHKARLEWAHEEERRFREETGLTIVSVIPKRDWEFLDIRYELPKERWWQFWRPCHGAASIAVPDGLRRVTA